MVESGTLPPVVQALMIQWTVLPRLLLDCGRVTSTQRLTIAAGCDVWAAVNAVWVDLELGVGAALAVAPPVTVCCAAGVVVLGWVLALADAEDLVVVELAVGICVAALPAAKVCLALPPPLPRPKVAPVVTVVAAVGEGDGVVFVGVGVGVGFVGVGDGLG